MNFRRTATREPDQPFLRRCVGAAQAAARSLSWYWLLLVVVVAVELFAVQQHTLDCGLWRDDALIRYARTRSLLDIFISLAVVCLLRPRWLIALFVGQAVFYGTVISYFNYYERALSVRTMLAQAGEGVAVSSAAIEVLGPAKWVLLGVLVIKLLLLRLAAREEGSWPTQAARGRRTIGVLAAATYASVLVGAHLTQRSLDQLARWADVGAVGYVYGYVPTWLGELYYQDNRDVLSRALKRGQIKSDLLSASEAPFPMRRNLAFVQLESADLALLDFAVRDHRGQRVVVTPNLNALRATSMFYEVHAPKHVGSCDSDFTALMDKLASTDVPAYRIDGYPYDDALVRPLNRATFETEALHGVSGRFFARRPAFQEMGFDALFFREELVPALRLTNPGWTVDDDDLFRFAAGRMHRGQARKFQMVITATSHMPFGYTPKAERLLYPGRVDAEWAYFDAMHYLDKSLGEYLRSLPRDTTVVIYGDHWSKVQNGQLGYRHQMRDGFGLVPFLVHSVGEDLSGHQRTREGLARKGQLTLLDMFTWVHTQVRTGLRTGERVSSLPQRPPAL